MTESAHAPFLLPSAPSPADQSGMLDWLAAAGWVAGGRRAGAFRVVPCRVGAVRAPVALDRDNSAGRS